MQKFVPYSEVERGIIERFDRMLKERGYEAESAISKRYLSENAKEELIERARRRGDWAFVNMLHDPSANSRAALALEYYMLTLYEEVRE